MNPHCGGCGPRESLVDLDREERGLKMTTMVLIYVRKGKQYRVYSQTNYPNGWRRELLATFRTRYDAEQFMLPR